MSSETKQVLKQLRKALNEQREHEMFLRAEAAHHFDARVEKLVFLMPFLLSKFTPSTTTPSAQAPQILLLTKLVQSLTDGQVAAIQEHLSVEQKQQFLEIWSAITRAAHTTSSDTSQDPSSSPPPPATGEESAADPSAPIHHWLYPNPITACGLSIDDLPPEEFTFARHEVTCSDCLHTPAEPESTASRKDL
jgi:hypothetical protein